MQTAQQTVVVVAMRPGRDRLVAALRRQGKTVMVVNALERAILEPPMVDLALVPLLPVFSRSEARRRLAASIVNPRLRARRMR